MQQSDLGLLRTTLVLLEEQHVTRAAARLHLSVSATSRALARSRSAFGDQLLVRSGRNVIITPRGEELRAEIAPILANIERLFLAPVEFDPGGLRGAFTIRASEAVMAGGGGRLLALCKAEAPQARVTFEIEASDDIDAVQSGAASMAVGSYSSLPSELNAEHLVTEHLVAVVRSGHRCLESRVTARRFADLGHVVVSRRGISRGPIDDQLAELNLSRTVVAVVPSFAAALAMAAQSDDVAIVPSRLAGVFSAGAGLELFDIPVPTPAVDVRQVWHRRYDNDAAHQWLRSCARRSVQS